MGNKHIIALTILYFAISFVGICHHELWLDEAHHWLLARDSKSIADLVTNTRAEGHPVLWNFLLFTITRFTQDVFYMQLLHIAISTASVAVFLKKAPFPILFKILTIFGYFMLFEYNIISRNYILGVFFLFMACSLFRERQKYFIVLSTSLACAANVHLMFLVISCALFLLLLSENHQSQTLFKSRFVVGYLIVCVGIVLSVAQIVSAENLKYINSATEIPFNARFTKGFISLFKGLYVIPDFSSIHFWNSNIIVNLSKPLAGLFGLLAYTFPLLLFHKNRKILIFVYTALIGTQLFFFLTQRSATRFDGMTYLIILAGLWLNHYYTSEDSKLTRFLNKSPLSLLRKPLLYSILSIHFLSGIVAFTMDYRNQFSGAKAAADYLLSTNLSDLPIVSENCEGTSVSPYLQKKIWSLCTNQQESFCRWTIVCENSDEDRIRQLERFTEQFKHSVFLANDSLSHVPSDWKWKSFGKFKVRFRAKFDTNIVRKSNYYIYEIFNEAKLANTDVNVSNE